jgi:hypothetical protein
MLLAAIVALWDNLQVIGPSVFLYFIMPSSLTL